MKGVGLSPFLFLIFFPLVLPSDLLCLRSSSSKYNTSTIIYLHLLVLLLLLFVCFLLHFDLKSLKSYMISVVVKHHEKREGKNKQTLFFFFFLFFFLSVHLLEDQTNQGKQSQCNFLKHELTKLPPVYKVSPYPVTLAAVSQVKWAS